MWFDSRGVVLGFLGATAVVGALLWLVGFDQTWAAVSHLSVRSLALVVGAGLCWLAAWGLSFRSVLVALDLQTSVPTALLLFASAEFANNVTPFGQAGGEPFSALLVSRATDSPYETALAAVASVDAINVVPSVGFAVVGLVYYATTVAVHGDVLLGAGVVVLFVACLPLLGYLVWTNRERVERGVGYVLAGVLGGVATLVPPLTPPSRAEVRSRAASFFDAVGRVGRNRTALATAIVLSALGWLFTFLALYLSVRALAPTTAVPAFAILLVVPLATVAGVLPLPGGAGGVEAALVLLLVPTTGVSPATAATAALVYRGGTYWLSTFLGGTAAAFLGGFDAVAD